MIVESPSFDFPPTGFSFDNALLVLSENISLDNLRVFRLNKIRVGDLLNIFFKKKKKKQYIYAFS